MRLERRREERLVDRAKRRSVASLKKKVLAARVARAGDIKSERDGKDQGHGEVRVISLSDATERCVGLYCRRLLPSPRAFLVWFTSTLTSIRVFTYKPSICSPFNLTHGV